MFVVDTLEEYILFSCLGLLLFSIYLNTIKKKPFFQIQILSTVKINQLKITDI